VTAEAAKRLAGEHAAGMVESGMVVGLGTGSTAVWAVRAVGRRLASGELRDVVAVPTSDRTADDARALGIPLLDDDVPWEIDLTIDGADEVDPALELIKGGGGALLREKFVAQASRREVIVVDESKPSAALGTRFALPIEVVAFGLATMEQFLRRLGARPILRLDGGGTPFRTDSGNLIVDAGFGPIADPAALARVLADHAGVVEHGLFVGIADTLVIGHGDGSVTVQERRRG
jgi:ribose 5-phosphate isomerase A